MKSLLVVIHSTSHIQQYKSNRGRVRPSPQIDKDNGNQVVQKQIPDSGNHERVVDLILKGKVEPQQSLEPGQPGVVFRYAFENPMKEHYYESDSVLLDRAIEWFGDVIEKSERLTSGNVSHQGATIRAFAKNCVEFINLHRMKK